MKISGSKKIGGSVPLSGVGRSAPHERVEQAAEPIAPVADVQISASSREVSQALSALAAIPEARIEKVQEIKPRVEDGTYRVESRVLAKKMVDTALRESAVQTGRRTSRKQG